MENIERHTKIYEWIQDIAFNDDKSLSEKSDDSFDVSQIDSLSNDDIPFSSDSDGEKRRLLTAFLKLCGSTTPIKITKSFNGLESQSKSNFLSCTRNLIRHVIKFVAEFDSADVRRLLFNETSEYHRISIPR